MISFIGCIESLMPNIGLEKILKRSFAGVEKMPKGKKCPMKMRAQWMIIEELLRRKAASFSQYSDLKYFLKLYLETVKQQSIGLKTQSNHFSFVLSLSGLRGKENNCYTLLQRKACFPTFMMQGITVMLGMAHVT